MAWDPHLDVLAVVAVIVGLYVVALRVVAPRVLEPGEERISRRQLRFLVIALGALWLFSAWPVHNLAEGFSYTVHMVQHSVYTLAVPPLLIWARRRGCGVGGYARCCPSSVDWSSPGWRWWCTAR